MSMIPADILRIMDANFNRMGEGLRVLEEFARLSLNDSALTERLKSIRHATVIVDEALRRRLLAARDSAADVGAAMNVPGEDTSRDIRSVVTANAKRVQESLRVIEEIAKSPENALDSETYRWARFALYEIEKTLVSQLFRGDRLKRLTGLYVIIDTSVLPGRDPVAATAQAIRGGAAVIQLRDKATGKAELLATARSMKELCAAHDVLFIMNDYLDIALAADADGLHIGPEDLPATVARKLLSADMLLGCSARTVEKAQQLQDEGADYLGIGAMFATAVKVTAEVVGPERLREIRAAVDLQLVAIGGINKGNIGRVLEAKPDAVAVISAVSGAEDIEKAARELVALIEGENRG